VQRICSGTVHAYLNVENSDNWKEKHQKAVMVCIYFIILTIDNKPFQVKMCPDAPTLLV
jgi:hypothetical protein